MFVILKSFWNLPPWKILYKIIVSDAMPFYAVAKGRTPGIFMTWADCEAQVKGFSGAKYKKFDAIVDAQKFIDLGGNNVSTAPKSKTKSNPNILNLKRPFSTSSQSSVRNSNGNSKVAPKKVKYSKTKPLNESFDSETYSDDSDDWNTVLTKQMDDIEKRLQGFEKGVDKILKKKVPKHSNRRTILLESVPNKCQKKKNIKGFEEDDDGFIHVYTDGACSANGCKGAKAGLGVYWGENHELNRSEPISGRATNNCGEIQAAIYAIKLALENNIKKLAINTDSKFLINSVTKWMPGWKKKGWRLKSGEPVKNEKDFKELDAFQHQLEVRWNYVSAHKGISGNEMADRLAKAGASMYNDCPP